MGSDFFTTGGFLRTLFDDVTEEFLKKWVCPFHIERLVNLSLNVRGSRYHPSLSTYHVIQS